MVSPSSGLPPGYSVPPGVRENMESMGWKLVGTVPGDSPGNDGPGQVIWERARADGQIERSTMQVPYHRPEGRFERSAVRSVTGVLVVAWIIFSAAYILTHLSRTIGGTVEDYISWIVLAGTCILIAALYRKFFPRV
jgi:hypothetical protein